MSIPRSKMPIIDGSVQVRTSAQRSVDRNKRREDSDRF